MNTIFQVLTLAYTLQGGQYFNNAMNDAGVFTTNNNYFIQTSFEFQVPFSWTKGDKNNLFIGSETENQFFPSSNDPFNFSPWQDTFRFNAGLRFFGVEFEYQHECVHPIVFDQSVDHGHLSSNYDKIYLKLTGSF